MCGYKSAPMSKSIGLGFVHSGSASFRPFKGLRIESGSGFKGMFEVMFVITVAVVVKTGCDSKRDLITHSTVPLTSFMVWLPKPDMAGAFLLIFNPNFSAHFAVRKVDMAPLSMRQRMGRNLPLLSFTRTTAVPRMQVDSYGFDSEMWTAFMGSELEEVVSVAIRI